MEATFPLSPFQREQHFSPAIQITEPFGIFLVLKMRPCIILDCFEGRHMNTGHSLEAMWFIMDLGKRLNRPELIMKAKDTALKMVNYGWDKEDGGLFYFKSQIT